MMPSPEQLYQPPVFESPPADQKSGPEHATTSPQMERVVTQLAEAYCVDLSQKGANLSLDMPDRPDRWMIANLDGQRLSLTRCFVAEDGELALDLDMVFTLNPSGLEPVEIVHAPAVWQAYTEATQAAGQSVTEAQSDFDFVTFADYMAEELEQQGWLEQAHQVDEQVPWLEDPK